VRVRRGGRSKRSAQPSPTIHLQDVNEALREVATALGTDAETLPCLSQSAFCLLGTHANANFLGSSTASQKKQTLKQKEKSGAQLSLSSSGLHRCVLAESLPLDDDGSTPSHASESNCTSGAGSSSSGSGRGKSAASKGDPQSASTAAKSDETLPDANSGVGGAASTLTRGIKPPRAKSPYNYFCKTERERVLASMPQLSFGQVNRELGSRWKAMSAEQRAPFVEISRQEQSQIDLRSAFYLPPGFFRFSSQMTFTSVQSLGSEFEWTPSMPTGMPEGCYARLKSIRVETTSTERGSRHVARMLSFVYEAVIEHIEPALPIVRDYEHRMVLPWPHTLSNSEADRNRIVRFAPDEFVVRMNIQVRKPTQYVAYTSTTSRYQLVSFVVETNLQWYELFHSEGTTTFLFVADPGRSLTALRICFHENGASMKLAAALSS